MFTYTNDSFKSSLIFGLGIVKKSFKNAVPIRILHIHQKLIIEETMLSLGKFNKEVPIEGLILFLLKIISLREIDIKKN